MTHHDTNTDAVKQLGEKIKGIRIAMMTTEEEDGMLRSRPMATQEMEFDGDLWFFTQASAPKVGDVEHHSHINLSYVDHGDSRYVSVSGTAELVRDRQKMQELWKPFYKAWFPNGLDDPELALLKVTVTDAQYWDAPSSKLVHLALVAKSAVTGRGDQVGENKKLDVK